MVKSTSENALRNNQKKKPERPRKRSARKPRPAGKKRPPVNAIFLVGFMGAGKSSVGRVLGQRLNWVFEDLDDRIQHLEGRTITEIFRESGEAEFRRAEHSALEELLQELGGGAAKVVALGGGAFVQADNAALLKNSGAATVFLDATVKELWERCCKQADESGTERPLLRSQAQFQELQSARRGSYLKATKRVDTGGRSLEAIASQIIDDLGLKPREVRAQEGEIE